MIVFPAIDIRNGKCVRLYKGEFDKETVYSDDPAGMALNWQNQGAKYLHVVDLDGARAGSPQNLETIQKIIKAVNIPVQIGGGIRNIDTAKKIIEIGAERIIIGTSAITEPAMLPKAVEELGEKLVVGIDSKDGLVAIQGWETKSSRTTLDFAKEIKKMGIKTIICTEISRDGTLQGPDTDGIKVLVQQTGIDVIASGGVGSLDDLIELKQAGAKGAIVGKALYSGNITMQQIIEIYK
ncbi:MAG: 1-(5-phosphoribosyl)-5-[(5-phosphoribosylamino)methylideneamino]imidazole-4-carboxamide isomerase [Deltaproteobacteria bacterium]